jgi:hypothetical protein
MDILCFWVWWLTPDSLAIQLMAIKKITAQGQFRPKQELATFHFNQ